MKRLYFENFHMLFTDIIEVSIDNKLIFINSKISYTFLKRNIKKITQIKTNKHVLKFKNNKLHCLDGPAIHSYCKDEKFNEIDRYYIDGVYYFAIEYFKHEKRLQYIKKKERLRKFNNLI